MVTPEIRAVLEALAAQPALCSEANFASRADALDELEFHVVDRLDGLLAAGPSAALSHLRKQAVALKERLEAIDRQLFRRLRAAVRAGQHTPETLWALLAGYMGPAGLGNGLG